VIKHCEERCDEDDGGQHTECEITQLRTRLGKVAKDKMRSRVSITKQCCDRITGLLKGNSPNINFQHEHREHEL
jgi:hypothetical protein